MSPLESLRLAGPPLLAVAAALWVERRTLRRGLVPPGFCEGGAGGGAPAVRRALALSAVGLAFWAGVFGPLGSLGGEGQVDYSAVDTPQLFLLHSLFAACLAAWYVAGFAVPGRRGSGREWLRQFGFSTPDLRREVALGLAAGVGAWAAVIAVMVALGALVWQLGGEEALPAAPPPMVPWIAGLPLWVRLAVAGSAGLVEEAFFRGFLQPRVGVGLSGALFVLAHLSYEQPFMLVGVALLSFIFAGLVAWRQSIWAAVVAHAVFDAIQLTVVIPILLRFLPPGAGEALASAPAAW